MASWHEINRFHQDREAARSLAAWLFELDERGALTEWEADFLFDVERFARRNEINTRQAEKLLEIRDKVELVSKHQGFSVGLLVKGCYEGRLDLSEDDEDWIANIHAITTGSIRRRDLGRLMRCAEKLGLIDR